MAPFAAPTWPLQEGAPSKGAGAPSKAEPAQELLAAAKAKLWLSFSEYASLPFIWHLATALWPPAGMAAGCSAGWLRGQPLLRALRRASSLAGAEML